MTASIIYQGSLRCQATHLQSGTVIESDAPTDNRGKGERFSPTDLLCVSMGTCIITTIGIKANDMGIDVNDTKLEVTKHMLNDPRRVGQIDVNVKFPPSLVIMKRIKLSCKEPVIIAPLLKVFILI